MCRQREGLTKHQALSSLVKDYKEDGLLGLFKSSVFFQRQILDGYVLGMSLRGVHISFWDEPAPLMDLAAAAYTLVCAKDKKK